MSAFQKTYDAEAARRYRDAKKRGKDRAEMRLLERAFEPLPRGARVLDVPCGYGRAARRLAELGCRVTAADLSPAMLELAREELAGLDVPLERQDLFALGHGERSFDAVLCFRVFHHFPDDATRAAAVRELCRVARERVVLSYLASDSLSARLDRLRAPRVPRHYTSVAELRRWFEPQGFALERDLARLSIVHSLHLSVWVRRFRPESP